MRRAAPHPVRPVRPSVRLLPTVAVALAAVCLPLVAAAPAAAQAPPCRPCAGLMTDAPVAVAEIVAREGRFDERQPLYAAWDVPLLDPGAATAAPADVAADAAASRALRDAGATPWARLVFTAPPPLAGGSGELEPELEAAARLVRDSAPDTHFQILWRPRGDGAPGTPGGAADASEWAFLIKRAAVAVTGARPDARVIVGPVPGDEAFLRALYDAEVGPYLDGIVLGAPGGRLDGALPAALALLAELDPGRPVVVDGLALPDPPARALAVAAAAAAEGFAVALFEAPAATAETVSPFVVLAREFGGDLSYDASYGPFVAGTERAVGWSFVRGEDLALRAIVDTGGEPGGDPRGEVTLRFPDPQLLSPEQVEPGSGDLRALFGVRRTAEGISVPVRVEPPVVVLRLERSQATDLEAVSEEVTVAEQRTIPVEEILRRLQAFEDAQARRIDHYSATNTTHLRFGAGAGAQSVEATLEGAFFFRQGQGFDWAWQRFFINGLRWRGEKIPEIPLVQPEKAAVMPAEISFTRQYDYTLAGSDQIDGRDAWVVEFRPAVAPEEGKLYRGRAWIDKEIYARLRSRAVQLGLEGEVVSNEETLFYTPVDAAGESAPYSPESFFLPLRLEGQQLISVVNATTLVERETVLSDVSVNAADFAERRLAVMASDATMVRDTAKGLRYLVKQEGTEERAVQEGFDTNRLFALGGVFYDESLDFPLPLGGVNYLDFDHRGTGNQLNVFFAGALVTLSYADPKVGSSRFDLGGDLFLLAVPTTDEIFRDGREAVGEEVEAQTGNLSLKAGRPIGSFVKLSSEYELTYLGYGRTSNTADAFRLPSDHVRHSFQLGGRFARSGYSLGLSGSYNLRSQWEEWGFPGNPAFSPDHEDYLRWGAGFAKSWYLPSFQKVGVEVNYVDGQDLDRFSKYDFGFFGSTRVHGYQSDLVKATSAYLTHLSYGFELGKAIRLDLVADAAWATDEEAGLDNELLAGVGLQGTVIGPWQTLINLDFGVPVKGPDESGFSAYLVVLKLFEWERLERWLGGPDRK